MADKEQQSPSPVAPTSNRHARSSDMEAAAAAHDARELRKKKRTKCLLYIVLFVIFQTGIITLFALTVMKVRTPKFRVREATVTNFTNGTSTTLNVELSVKNTNFGRYKYRNTTVVFYYGTETLTLGEVAVTNSRANWRSTKKFNVSVDLNLSKVDSDLNAGFVTIRSEAKLRGRVELMFVMKKNRATHMNCTMELVMTPPQRIRNVRCE